MQEQQQIQQQSPLDGKLTTMPAYYLPKGGAKKTGGISKNMLLIIVGIICLLIIAVFILLYLQSRPAPELSSTAPVTDMLTQQPPAERQVEEQLSEQLTESEEEAAPSEEPLEEMPVTNLIPELTLSGVTLGTDTDQDGMTDAEESVFLTSSAAPDTDQDGFLDGSELANLYDPATPGALLEVSPQISIARNPARGYQLLIPDSFTFQVIDVSGTEMRITTPDGTETFTIRVIENPDRMTPVQWYQNEDPGADLSVFNNFENEAGWNGIQSQDGRVIISTFGTSGPGSRAFIFIMHYDPGAETVLRFPTIWQMMVQSLAILEVEQDDSLG